MSDDPDAARDDGRSAGARRGSRWDLSEVRTWSLDCAEPPRREGGAQGNAAWLARWRWAVLFASAGLSVVAYLRALGLPFISDDYLQIALARQFGPLSGWTSLASDALYRCRATSLVLTYWTERLLGLDPALFRVSSLVLHILNTWLVFALGCWRPVGWRVSALAACFFAFYLGHQEAVIWYAALPELLVFFFGLASLLCWILWLQGTSGRPWLYGASLALFTLALLSKESGVVVVGLMLLAVGVERTGWRRRLLWMLPFALLAGVYFLLALASRGEHLHFNDGTFSLQGPLWMVLPRSMFRLFWIWGLISLLALAVWRARRWTRLLLLAAAWIVVAFLPYSFLTYMPHVPSRHTYFASVGLAFVIAAGFLAFRERFRARPWAAGLVAAIIVAHHCTYLWTRKHGQYVVRAAPTEAVVEYASQNEGAVYLDCFPYDISLARLAVEIRLGNRPVQILKSGGEQPAPRPTLNLCSVADGQAPPPAAP